MVDYIYLICQCFTSSIFHSIHYLRYCLINVGTRLIFTNISPSIYALYHMDGIFVTRSDYFTAIRLVLSDLVTFDAEFNLMIFAPTIKLLSIKIDFPHLKDCHVLSLHQIKVCTSIIFKMQYGGKFVTSLSPSMQYGILNVFK